MGIFEDAKKQADDAMQQAMGNAAAQGGAGWANQAMATGQAEAAAVRSEAEAIDVDNDPAFAPIEGVSYRDYVALCIKIAPAGTDEAKQIEIAKANGYDEAKWKAVSGGFTQRCIENQKFARRLGMDVMAADK
ncbi:MAG: hypothetical protein WEC34_08340 [Acidimicrobiia bacterium]